MKHRLNILVLTIAATMGLPMLDCALQNHAPADHSEQAGKRASISCCALHAEENYLRRHYSIEDGMSQNTVMAILQDKQGYMWFGTWDGLNRFDGYNFEVFKAMENGEESKVNNRVDVIYEDEEEQLWWMTYDNHYYMIDKERKVITSKTLDDLPEGMREQIAQDGENLKMDKHGIIWQADDKEGVLRYRYGHWKRFTPKLDSRFAGQLREHFFILEDCLGRTWVNPTGGGWSYYDYDKDELVNPLKGLTNMIHTAYVNKDGLMWIATYENGVECINMEPQPYELTDMRNSPKESGEVRAFVKLRNGDIQTIVKDKRRIYCGLDSRYGLLYGTKGHGLKNTTTGETIKTSSPDVYDIIEGADGTLYVGTYGGGVNILRYDSATGHFKEPLVVGNGLKVRNIQIVDNILWCGTTTGIFKINLDNLNTEIIPSYDIRSVYYSQDKLWLGTFGGGLNVLDPKDPNSEIKRVNTMQNIILSIVGDGQNLWFSSERDITQLNIASGSIQYYDALDGQKDTYFTEAKAVRTATGIILFGYSNGYCAFDPSKITHTQSVPPMRITHCSSGGTQLDPAMPIEIADGGNITIQYAALEYVGAHKIAYAYKMDGLSSDDWHYVYDQRKVTYTNLGHGKYTFRVRSTNREGVEVDNEIRLPIIVKAPLWMSWWAICLYILGFVVVIFIAVYIIYTYEKLRQKVQVEQQVTDIKLRFFTNISHELRTPLTLIIGPVENILQTERISTNVRNQLEIVQSNSQRMLRMVNQLLDFRKIQNKKMRLKIQKSLLSDLVDETCANFKKEAYDKRINLNIEKKASDSTVWVDRNRVDTILFNLLSNAFKFTPSGKNITVTVDEKPGYVLLIVKDEGVGIPMEKRGILFERFSSNNELSGHTSNTGTGIGMNLVKELVDLHHGYIEVESEVGKGTTFTIMFRTGNEHFGNEVDIIVDDDSTATIDQPADILENKLTQIEEEHSRRRTILVVDDNEDMRSFLNNILSTEYHVLTASDGVEALAEVEKTIPDMVITDLMMPNMDGIELTNHIKQSPDLNHIPVVLLSAKSAIESRLEAMKEGADDYVTKPFEPEYLRAHVRNLITQREQLEMNYRQRLMRLEPQKADENISSDSFLAKLLNIMDKQMENNTLTVDELVEDMGMGRTVFFNKLKSLTGLSPVEFIREMRIKRAAQLLEQKNYNITEVTYMVGMNDSRYFAKCFKATYGVTPSEYRKSRIADEEK